MAKILIVEDERDLADSIRDWLILENHWAQTSYDAPEALERLRNEEYDLIILDLMLPKMSGIEVCKAYRKNGGAARVLILTAKNSTQEKELGLDSGADDYISKPCDLREISARVRALMRRSLLVCENKLVAADLTIDMVSREITRQGTAIRLLPQEAALLEFFMRHPNRLFSADDLIKRVWRGGSNRETVRTHIKTLRKKVDAPGLQPLIKTVHGLGYCLNLTAFAE